MSVLQRKTPMRLTNSPCYSSTIRMELNSSIKKILNSTVDDNGILYYEVKWNTSWVSEEVLSTYPDLVDMFWKFIAQNTSNCINQQELQCRVNKPAPICNTEPNSGSTPVSSTDINHSSKDFDHLLSNEAVVDEVELFEDTNFNEIDIHAVNDGSKDHQVLSNITNN